jgi:N-acetylglucosamine-6-phosphate deacetylase
VSIHVLEADAVVTPGGVLAPATVLVDRGRIAAVERGWASPAASAPGSGGSPGPEVTRVAGTVVPGFVDLQVNGIGGVDVATAATDEAWGELDRHLLAQGTTTWCPTVISRSLAAYEPVLARLTARGGTEGRRPHLAGVHLEGPFLTVPGAHPPAALRDPDLAWLGALPDLVRMVTLAPERPGALDAVALLAARGVLVSVGHTAAPGELVHRAADRGARLVTHLWNTMPPVHHREPGPVVAGLLDDRLALGLIADGVHLHPDVLALVRRAAGPGRCVLVTDQVAAGPAPPAGGRAGAGSAGEATPPRRPDGTLAGSALRMDRAVRNAVVLGGWTLAEAVHAASALPAQLLGLTDRGAVAAGCRADLVLLDEELRATRTWLAEDLA